MDLTSESNERSVQLFPTWGKILIGGTIILTLLSFYAFELEITIIISTTVLCAIGIVTTDAWNRELKEDGYAALTQLYSSYFAALFLFIALVPVFQMMFTLRVGIPFALLIAFVYAIILSSLAFKGIEDHDTAVRTYTGPAVVYIPDGPYVSHIEEIANEKYATIQNESSEEEEE